jgi:hypothetical protein
MFIVVDTTNWFGGKKVLIPISHIKKIEWTDNLVYLNVSKAAVDHSPLFKEADYLQMQ